MKNYEKLLKLREGFLKENKQTLKDFEYLIGKDRKSYEQNFIKYVSKNDSDLIKYFDENDPYIYYYIFIKEHHKDTAKDFHWNWMFNLMMSV